MEKGKKAGFLTFASWNHAQMIRTRKNLMLRGFKKTKRKSEPRFHLFFLFFLNEKRTKEKNSSRGRRKKKKKR
jgi:hypothetical protein